MYITTVLRWQNQFQTTDVCEFNFFCVNAIMLMPVTSLHVVTGHEISGESRDRSPRFGCKKRARFVQFSFARCSLIFSYSRRQHSSWLFYLSVIAFLWRITWRIDIAAPPPLYKSLRHDTIDTIRDAILTCAQKPTWVSLIYRTETDNEKVENRKKLKSKKRICSEVSVNSLGESM